MAISMLDALLGALSVEIQAFAICEIADGVRLTFPPVGAIEVHHVLEGTLHVTIDDREPIEVPTGGMLIVPPGRLQHLAASRAAVMNKAASDACLPVREGMIVFDATRGQMPRLRVACGTVLSDTHGSYGPLDGLSQPIAENLSDVPVVAAAFNAMLIEAAAPSEGTMALSSALMKACLVILLRRHLQSSKKKGTPPALFRDTRLGRAVAAILNCPAAPHSVTSLAKEAGMSRSAFARDFKALIDAPPMEFVARVRLDLARRLLLSTDHPIVEIAATVGFSSRSHFSRLFRDHYGSDPSTFRRCNLEKHGLEKDGLEKADG